MSTRIHVRLKKLETRLNANTSNGETLEQACRMTWLQDRQSFLRLTDNLPYLRPFVGQFEQEDRDRERRLSRK